MTRIRAKIKTKVRVITRASARVMIKDKA